MNTDKLELANGNTIYFTPSDQKFESEPFGYWDFDQTDYDICDGPDNLPAKPSPQPSQALQGSKTKKQG